MEKVKNKISDEMQVSEIEAEILTNRRSVQIPGDTKEYCVRVPTPEEIMEAQKIKAKEFNNLLFNSDIRTNKEIDQELKKRGIKSLDEELEPVKKELEEFYVSLAVTDDKEKDKIEKKKKEIINLKTKINNITNRTLTYYQYSCEGISTVKEHHFLTFKCSEVKKDDEWEAVWKDFGSFLKDKDTKGVIFIEAFTKFYWGIGRDERPFVS